MIKDSLTLRSVAIARLFPAQLVLEREDKLSFYTKIIAEGLDLPEFSQALNHVVLQNRRPGPPEGVFQIVVDHFGQQFRLMIHDDFPTRAFALITKDADTAWESFLAVWPLQRLGSRPILTEVTLRMTAAAPGGNATQYLMDRILHLPRDAQTKLGRSIHGLGLKLVFPLQVSSDGSIPLDGADANLVAETLLDDPSRFYFEFTTKWPSLALPPEIVSQGGPPHLNPDIRKPSEYLEETYAYLTETFVAFLHESSH